MIKKLIVNLVFILLFSTPVMACTRYWVGGGSSANWSATVPTNWATSSNGSNNAAVPVSTDDVCFDGVGAGASNSTLDTAFTINSLDMTGYSNTLTHNAAVTLTIAGNGVNFKLSSTMTYTLGNATTSALSFTGTSGTTNITTGGNTLGNVTFNGTGGWQLQDSFTTSSTGVITLTKGTLDFNGQTVTTGTISSSNSNTRTLTLGASTINLNSGNFTLWLTTTSTNMTFNAGTSTISITDNASCSFAGGSLTYNNLTATASATMNINGAATFNNFTVNGTLTQNAALSLSTGFTVTGTLTLNGYNATNRLIVFSNTPGTVQTITSAANSMSNVDFQDITGAGAANWNLSAITGLSGDCGGNSGMTLSSPVTQTWQTAAGGTWSTLANWTSRVPLCQDNVVMGIAYNASVTIFDSVLRSGNNIDWTGATNSPFWAVTNSINIYGSLTLISNMTYVQSQNVAFNDRGAITLTTAGKTFSTLIFTLPGGSLTLQDSLNSTGGLTLNNGTLNANNFNVTVTTFNSNNSNIRTITMGSGTWTLNGTGTVWTTATSTGLTLNQNTSTIALTNTSATSKTFAGGGLTYNNLSITGSGTGAVIFTGANTFNSFTINAPKTVTFPASATNTFTTFSASGSGALGSITINSSTPGTQATLSQSSGTVSSDYLNLQDSKANGGATWNAGSNSINLSDNSGWIFTAPTANSIFMGGD